MKKIIGALLTVSVGSTTVRYSDCPGGGQVPVTADQLVDLVDAATGTT